MYKLLLTRECANLAKMIYVHIYIRTYIHTYIYTYINYGDVKCEDSVGSAGTYCMSYGGGTVFLYRCVILPTGCATSGKGLWSGGYSNSDWLSDEPIRVMNESEWSEGVLSSSLSVSRQNTSCSHFLKKLPPAPVP